MLSELQQDVLEIVALKLPIHDLIAVNLTCRFLHDATALSLARVRNTLLPKQHLWRYLGKPKIKGSDERNDHMFILAEEWASPHFTIFDALAKSNVENSTAVHVIASGNQSHMDEALLRLMRWLPHVCDMVNSVHFASQLNTWEHIHDKHVKLFRNATHVHVSDCDNISDHAFLDFTHAESIEVTNCGKLTGSFVGHLVTHHQLRHMSWCFTKHTAPLDLITHPPQLLMDALALGALKQTMSCWRGSGRSCWGPGTYLVMRLKQGDLNLASMANAISLELPSPSTP
jgi:hypothetical protein